MQRGWFVLLSLIFALSACRNKGDSQAAAMTSASAESPKPFELREDTPDITFTFLTTDGGFKNASKISDVPLESRDAVRVWNNVTGEGVSGAFVFVADLRMPQSDGTYSVRAIDRQAFDDMAGKRRQVEQAAKDSVIVYGADWCKACHAAEAFFKAHHVNYVHKNVDDAHVRDEMAQKGLSAESIPVLDIGGRILVGFDEGQVRGALKAIGKSPS